MKKFWYKPPKWDKKLTICAIESGFEAIYVEEDDFGKAKELSRLPIISQNKLADLVLGRDAAEIVIKNKESQERVV